MNFCKFSLASFPKDENRPVHLGIGIYDGLHRGHAQIFSQAQAISSLDGGICGALTFDPHPEVFFRGAGSLNLIYPLDVRAQLFSEKGLDFVIQENFTREFASIPAEDFVRFLKVQIPQLKAIYVGENFRFGAKRAGTVEKLRQFAKDELIDVYATEPVLFEGEKISSTRIREALSNGEMSKANAMLSKNYFCMGTVITGRQLGRTIGFPTLNLEWTPQLRPRYGVYLVKVYSFDSGTQFYGIANYGLRPTVEKEGTSKPLLEVHLLSKPDAGKIPTTNEKLKVEWLEFLRPEQKFSSLTALQAQLKIDINQALDKLLLSGFA